MDELYEYDPTWDYEWDDDPEEDLLSDPGYFDYDRLNELEARLDRFLANPSPPPPVYVPPEPAYEPEPEPQEPEPSPDLSTEEGRREAIVQMLSHESP